MLSQMLKQHQEQMKGRSETQEKLKKETVESANELTVNLVNLFLFEMELLWLIAKLIIMSLSKVDHLNVGVAQAYLNQKRLDLEAKNLNTNANNFNKQTQQWLSLIENFTSSLKVCWLLIVIFYQQTNILISSGARRCWELGQNNRERHANNHNSAWNSIQNREGVKHRGPRVFTFFALYKYLLLLVN